jgi:hypothetical protein
VGPAASKATPKGSIWNNPADAAEEQIKAIVKANPAAADKLGIKL